MAATPRWVHADAPNLWAVLDEATRVAERQLKVNAKEWWATMGHTAEVPLQVTSLRGMLNQHAQFEDVRTIANNIHQTFYSIGKTKRLNEQGEAVANEKSAQLLCDDLLHGVDNY